MAYTRESSIEKHLVAEVKKAGGIAYKFVSPGRRSVPDRLVLLPGGQVLFVECKAPGGTLIFKWNATQMPVRQIIELTDQQPTIWQHTAKGNRTHWILFLKATERDKNGYDPIKNISPRPYQNLIIDHSLNLPRTNIWAGMGMGKTVATLTTLEDLFMCGAETQPVLVLAPLRVARSTWPDEVDKWNHLRNIEMQPIVGTVKERLAALQNTNASVYTTNYDNLVWLVETLGGRWTFGTVVADESTRLKSFRLRQGGKRAAALAKVAHKHVHRWINLTGTPAPNGLIDLWGQAWFVDQGSRLGRTFGAFTSRWFNNIQFPGQQWSKLEPRPCAQEQMQAALRDVTISLDAADWFDIQEPIHNVIRVQMSAKARQQYQEMEKRMFLELDGTDIEAQNAAAKTVKCLQIASGAIYTDDKGSWSEIHDAKLQALESVIAESGGMTVLVAWHFKSDLARLLKAFPKGKHLDQDPQTLRDWNTGKIPVLFAHPASAGHGLNMQDGGNILAFFSQCWDPEQYQQIIERIGPTRQIQAGHNRPVWIHHIIAADTVDELVMQRRDSKREVQDILLEAMKKRGIA